MILPALQQACGAELVVRVNTVYLIVSRPVPTGLVDDIACETAMMVELPAPHEPIGLQIISESIMHLPESIAARL